MFDDGVLKMDENGQYQAVTDPEESEQIKSATKTRAQRAAMSRDQLNQMNRDLENMSN